ncbi:hypothetical protein AMS66_24060 [Paenibacillus xylanivorans]|uniref:WIAG-tail domain n=2 Tax=Paenibacillus xylanivorans TaxID=1705561 RepID=A0A0M9BLM8_9BACL|nr:hypothetical protein AMS66_24060 [Paenibacillus xylanivorans]
MADKSVQSRHIQDGTILADHIQERSIRTTHLEEEAVSGVHLQNGSVTSAKLADGSVNGSKLSEQSITSNHLNAGIVGPAHLSQEIWNAIRQFSGETLEQLAAIKRQEALLQADSEAVQPSQQAMVVPLTGAGLEGTQIHQTSNQELGEQQEQASQTDQLEEPLAAASLTTEEPAQVQEPQLELLQENVGTTEFKLSEQSVTQEHLCDEAVGSSQLQSGAVQAKHLAFQPVRSVSRQPVVQQFGMEAFILPEDEECVEVSVAFEESFISEHYVIVAMCNDRGFQVSLLSQSEDEAVLEVSRTAGSTYTYGLLSWIAAGPSV